MLAVEGDVASEFGKVAFVSEVQHEVPDVQAHSGNPSEGSLVELLFIAFIIDKLRTAVDEKVCFGPGLQVEGPGLYPEEKRKIEILEFFRPDSGFDSGSGKVIHPVIHPV